MIKKQVNKIKDLGDYTAPLENKTQTINILNDIIDLIEAGRLESIQLVYSAPLELDTECNIHIDCVPAASALKMLGASEYLRSYTHEAVCEDRYCDEE